MYKIVVTTNSFSNNDILVNELKTLTSNIVLNKIKRYTKDELIENLKNADAAIVGLDVIDESVLKECKNLKIIAKYGVGLNNLNLEDCKKHNVAIGWTGGVNKTSVAEMALGMMLMFSRNLFVTTNQLKNGTWNKSGGFQLSGKTVGIIGMGYIGKELARLLEPFRCKILVNDIINQDDYYKKHNYIEVSKKELYQESDFISIHTPQDESTFNFITLNEMKMMKSTVYLLNTARGGLINEQDLKYALQNNLIAGAGIDAYVEEPPVDKEFINLPNLICTPHIGGNAKEAVNAMGMSAIKHLKKYFKENS